MDMQTLIREMDFTKSRQAWREEEELEADEPYTMQVIDIGIGVREATTRL